MNTVKSFSASVLLATVAAGLAVAQPTLTPEDRSAIQALMGQYSQALSGCRAEEFADLFTPNGAFASGFRGVMVGRARLIALVQSERQCVAPPNADKAKAAAPRPGGATGPTTVLEVTANGVRGVASIGTTEYQDEYTKTAQGWRFASRTVITGPEKSAGLDARGIVAIQRLGGPKIGDYYEPDQNGVQRLMTSGVRVTVAGGQVTGRAFLTDGTHVDQVYEKLASGEWRVK